MSYLAVSWPEAEPGWVSELLAALPFDWRIALREPGRLIATCGDHPPAVHVAPGGVMLGEIHERPDIAQLGSGPMIAAARRLAARAWGGYVALLSEPRSGRWAVFRCPSGALDALVWRYGEAQFVAADLPAWLDPWAPRDLRIDWAQVAAILADPAAASGQIALAGLHAIAPGTLRSPDGGAQAVWTPASTSWAAPHAPCDARRRLREVVDTVVQAQAGARTVIELSGGLDSAIVASALRGRDVLAVNYFSRELGADERSFAREIAGKLGLPLMEVEKPLPAFDLQAMAKLAGGARPALNALDFEHDLDMAQRCRELGADALLTGQGGDHVFFQAPSALIAADALRAGLWPGSLATIARRTGRSAWSVLGEAAAANLRRPAAKPRPAHVSERGWEMAAAGAVHPWLSDAEDLSPGKRLQVACLAAAQALNGTSRRGAAARLRHPLLSQPVMELCLPLAAYDLALGGHDRALAREAFAERLPTSIIRRQGKGRLTSHYGRVIAAGLPELRALLLEGRLAEEGLLDLQALDRMLSVEHLAWRGGYGAIMTSAALELWVRAWEARTGVRPGRS